MTTETCESGFSSLGGLSSSHSHFSPLLRANFRQYISRVLNRPQLYDSTNYRLSSLLKYHTGCVNTLQWSSDGSLLLSGSDDQNIAIWDMRRSDHHHKRTHLFTTHTSNIFDAKFAPGRVGDRIVTVAGDGRVCVFDNWDRRAGDSLLPTQTLVASSGDGAKRLEFLGPADGNCFVVCCEDGHVQQFDLRERHSTKRSIISLADQQISLFSLSICPSAPHVMALGGSDPFVRFYDLRMASPHREPTHCWTPPLRLSKSTNFVTGVRFSRFSHDLAVNCIKDGPYVINHLHQTSNDSLLGGLAPHIELDGLAEEHRRWTWIANYYRAGRFEEAEHTLRALILQHRRLQSVAEWRVILAHELYARALCQGMSTRGDLPLAAIKSDLDAAIELANLAPAKYLLAMALLIEGHIEVCGQLCDRFLGQNAIVNDAVDWIDKLSGVRSIAAVCELDPAQIPKLIPRRLSDVCVSLVFPPLARLPAVQAILRHERGQFSGYLDFFPGLLLERTIKGISFVGDCDQYVAVGSDGGYGFLFPSASRHGTKQTLPAFAIKSDASVVNVIEGHPYRPCLAVSGIDDTIKIWEPASFVARPVDDESCAAIPATDLESLMQRLPSTVPGTRIEVSFPLILDPDAVFLIVQ